MKKQRDPEASRNALLDAAEKIFLEKGYGNTSLSQISKQAGMTKSLIHHYFGSKESLWTEVKTRRFMQYAERQIAMIEEAEPTVELLRASMALYFNFLQQNPEIVRILAWMFLENDEDGCRLFDEKLNEEGTAKIRAAQEAGMFRDDIDPRFVLFIFVGLCQNWFQGKGKFLSHHNTEGLPEDLDDAYLAGIVKIFFEGLLPRK